MKFFLALAFVVLCVVSRTPSALDGVDPSKPMAKSLNLGTVSAKNKYMSRRGNSQKSLADRFKDKITCRRAEAEKSLQKEMRDAEYSYRDAQESLVSITEDLPDDHPYKKYSELNVDFDQNGEMRIADMEGNLLNAEELLSDEAPSFETQTEFGLSTEEQVSSSSSDEGMPEEYEESVNGGYPAMFDVTEEELAMMDPEQRVAFFKKAFNAFKKHVVKRVVWCKTWC